ncbi:MAG: hypothetical protein Q8S73_02625 [Deltaproteobacteria bacterium]|nr:hypothetical protein [Deltaproteobacteria bacterium]
MSLESEMEAERELVQRITAVARRSSCPLLGDLWWDPIPSTVAILEDPGVMFESSNRVVVFLRTFEELRYYAGPWCPDDAHLYPDRIEAEGSEAGVVKTVADALAFAEQYLVEERGFDAVSIPRDVRYARAQRMEKPSKAAL